MTTVLYAEGCTAPDMGRLLEGYLSRELTEAQAALFEDHYFACNACLEAIRVRQSGPHALTRTDRFGTRRTRYLLGLIAAILVAGGAVLLLWRGGRPATSLAALSRTAAPSYLSSSPGGDDDQPRREFVEAMRYYQSGDFTRSITALETLWKRDPSRPETGYYLGAVFLMTNRVDRAIETLRATAGLGESRFLDPAKILLAKAYLRREAIDDARRELKEVVHRNGETRGEAEELLNAIDRASPAVR